MLSFEPDQNLGNPLEGRWSGSDDSGEESVVNSLPSKGEIEFLLVAASSRLPCAPPWRL